MVEKCAKGHLCIPKERQTMINISNLPGSGGWRPPNLDARRGGRLSLRQRTGRPATTFDPFRVTEALISAPMPGAKYQVRSPLDWRHSHQCQLPAEVPLLAQRHPAWCYRFPLCAERESVRSVRSLLCQKRTPSSATETPFSALAWL